MSEQRWVIWTPHCIQKVLVRDGHICAWADGSPYYRTYEPETYATWAEARKSRCGCNRRCWTTCWR